MPMHLKAIGLVLACVIAASSTLAADRIETRPVHFSQGASSATIEGSLQGDRTIDYTLRARSGQTMTVGIKTDNESNYFNVLPPGSNDVAVFVGSNGGNAWSGTLDADGVYKIRVYLMRNAARRNEKARYTLSVAITGDAGATAAGAASSFGKAPASDAKVNGTTYHATGTVPCSMGDAAPESAQCEFGVIRGSTGNAKVHLTPPGGFERVLTFIGGKVTAEGEAKVKTRHSSDDWFIDVNDYEHYRIPDAVISGG